MLSHLCKNIKSRHYPTLQCPNKASNGDYCSKHSKNPTPFIYSIKLKTSAICIQKCWRSYYKKNNFKRQGPAKNDYSLANNNCELYSLEPIETIPKVYFFSFYDSNKNIWVFDIRTLSYLLSKSKQIKNPYTTEILSQEIISKIKKRLSFLKEKKYTTMYIDNTNFTSEQIWNQNVLDIFTKMEELGYIVNSDWYHELDKEDHIELYKKLYDIWNYRLQLTNIQKNLIVPGCNGKKNALFKLYPSDIIEKDEKWLRKNNLLILQRLVSSTNDKTQSSLGVMYSLMGLCSVNDDVATAYPWIYASLS